MKKILLILSALCFAISFVLIFCLIGYGFTGSLTALLALFFIYLAFSLKAQKRSLIILRRIICTLAAIGILFTCVMSCIVASDMNGDAFSPCDCIIVLGAGLDGETPSLTLVDRLRKTYEYMETYPDSIAIVSGSMGTGETITEALAMERWLVSSGIEKERIIKEENATNTNENLIYSKLIAEKLEKDSIAIVSSDYHIFRARLLAEKQDISATMISAKTPFPILKINYIVRECFALVKAKLLGHI